MVEHQRILIMLIEYRCASRFGRCDTRYMPTCCPNSEIGVPIATRLYTLLALLVPTLPTLYTRHTHSLAAFTPVGARSNPTASSPLRAKRSTS